MTNGWIDIKNTDMMLIMGGNPAENHPCGFKWAIEAKLHRNAKLISVDPRFTRTSANADLYVPIRAVVGIYARENGQGMVFEPEDPPDDQPPQPSRRERRAALKIVK